MWTLYWLVHIIIYIYIYCIYVYIYILHIGQCVKTLYPFCSHQNSWVKMDVHPPKNGIFIGIDPYPYVYQRLLLYYYYCNYITVTIITIMIIVTICVLYIYITHITGLIILWLLPLTIPWIHQPKKASGLPPSRALADGTRILVEHGTRPGHDYQFAIENGHDTPSVHIKIAGLKWMFIPLKMVLNRYWSIAI